METYDGTKDRRQTTEVARKPAEQKILTMFPESPFANVAHEWNNALQIAVEKLWGDQPGFHRKGI